MSEQPLDLEPLQEFLAAHFTDSELRRLIPRTANGTEFRALLPGGSTSLSELAAAMVDLLQRHGAIDADFWARLREKRPRLGHQISALQARCPALASASSWELYLVLARATRNGAYIDVEFVVRNETEAPRFIKEIHLEAQNIVVDYRPCLKFKSRVTRGHLVLSLVNDGWSDLVMDVEVDLRPSSRAGLRRRSCIVISSGEEVAVAHLSEADIFAPESEPLGLVHVSVEGRDKQSGIYFHLDKQVQVHRDEYYPKRLTERCPAAPDTVYVCTLDTTSSTCRRRYDVFRQLHPRQADIFAVRLTLARSAKFDLLVDIVSTEGTRLSTRHDHLTVLREASSREPHRDGEVFVRDRYGSWALTERFARV